MTIAFFASTSRVMHSCKKRIRALGVEMASMKAVAPARAAASCTEDKVCVSFATFFAFAIERICLHACGQPCVFGPRHVAVHTTIRGLVYKGHKPQVTVPGHVLEPYFGAEHDFVQAQVYLSLEAGMGAFATEHQIRVVTGHKYSYVHRVKLCINELPQRTLQRTFAEPNVKGNALEIGIQHGTCFAVENC
jgi:hypothetical protein